jgi:preprotein translocase subunit SecD
LTLAGITGIIVAIGITADSYIVYFERVKEKLRDGSSSPEAADEGFKLAFRTILTADTVSLLGAVLLYALAVGAGKGFALALGLATVLDIIIARAYSRRAVQGLAETSLGVGGGFSIRGAAL